MKKIIVMALAILIVSAVAANATTHHSHHHAKVSLKSAEATARAEVPDGKLERHELETEKGREVYSFVFKVPGQSGIKEVNVDAMTGKVVNTEHESTKTEEHEKKMDNTTTKKAPSKY
jgi:hypothetical protein